MNNVMSLAPLDARRAPGAVAALAACLAAAILAGCAATGGGETGSAGTSAVGGTGGGATGGTSGVAGSGGNVGPTGSGGTTTGSGGVTGAGGVAGAGATAGSTATGGTPGSGGSTSTGGDGGGAAGSGGSAGVSGTGGSTGGGAAGSGGRGGSTGGGGRGGAAGNGGRGGATGGGGAAGGTGGTAPACTPGTKPSGGRMVCTNMRASAGGTYTYELWADGTGSGCMTVYNMDAKFSASWSGVKDLLARVGLGFDSTRTHTQIGTITADFNETKTGSDGWVYIGIYGWTVEPLKEFYIIDDWGAMKPGGVAPDGTPRTSVGTITVDGEIYDVYKRTRENKPNITGTDQTFEQYFSIRRTARQCGRISVSTHFNEWTRLGLPMGKMYEAMLLVEAQNSTGTIDFTTATVVAR
jgi:hypothetical protein